MHHRSERARAFEIRRRDVHLWTNDAPAVDQLLDFQIVVRLDTARCTNCRHAERQIEPRKTGSHVRVHWRIAAHRKKHVVVHADQTGQNCVAFQIEHLRVGRNIRSGTRRD